MKDFTAGAIISKLFLPLAGVRQSISGGRGEAGTRDEYGGGVIVGVI